jgi:hypothetical protein
METPVAALDLLLVHADTQQPLAESSASTGSPASWPQPTHLGTGLRPNNLSRQGWGLVAPDSDRGRALVQAVAPLVQHRCRELGVDRLEPYWAPDKLTQPEAVQWCRRHVETGRVAGKELPSYLLILGDLHEVPVQLQKVLASRGFVGRLAFDDLSDYEAYAHKVVKAEERGGATRRGKVQFFTARDSTAATKQGFEHLVEPALDMLTGRWERRQLWASAVDSYHDPAGLGPDKLLDLVGDERPTVLFSLNHGLGPLEEGKWSDARQRAEQGGVSFGTGNGALIGEEVRHRPFLPGGVWFMVSCYGAGTPHCSDYKHWLDSLPFPILKPDTLEQVVYSLAGKPFIAALPKAVLANEHGPLAVIGHVDLAWGFSYREVHDGNRDQTGRFVDVIDTLLDGGRAGLAFRELYKHLGMTNLELTARADQRASASPDPMRAKEAMNHNLLWLLRQDLAAYILLGDPAVQLPLQSALSHAAARTAAPEVAAGTAEVPALAEDQRDLEKAVGQILSGKEGTKSRKKIAKKVRMDLAELEALVERYKVVGRRALIGGE